MLRETPHEWITLALAWLLYFSWGLISSAFAPLVTPIMTDLNLTYTQTGIIAGAWQLIYVFAAYATGLSIDRLGTWKSLLLGVIVISFSSVLRTFAADFQSLFLFIALFVDL